MNCCENFELNTASFCDNCSAAGCANCLVKDGRKSICKTCHDKIASDLANSIATFKDIPSTLIGGFVGSVVATILWPSIFYLVFFIDTSLKIPIRMFVFPVLWIFLPPLIVFIILKGISISIKNRKASFLKYVGIGWGFIFAIVNSAILVLVNGLIGGRSIASTLQNKLGPFLLDAFLSSSFPFLLLIFWILFFSKKYLEPKRIQKFNERNINKESGIRNCCENYDIKSSVACEQCKANICANCLIQEAGKLICKICNQKNVNEIAKTPATRKDIPKAVFSGFAMVVLGTLICLAMVQLVNFIENDLNYSIGFFIIPIKWIFLPPLIVFMMVKCISISIGNHRAKFLKYIVITWGYVYALVNTVGLDLFEKSIKGINVIDSIQSRLTNFLMESFIWPLIPFLILMCWALFFSKKYLDPKDIRDLHFRKRKKTKASKVP